MSVDFSTGSQELDALLEELRAGDNVVFFARDARDYFPFVSSSLQHAKNSRARLLYVRSSGSLDEMISAAPGAQVLDIARFAASPDPLVALQDEIASVDAYDYYMFDPLLSFTPLFGGEDELAKFFVSVCPLLFRLDSVAYWYLAKGTYSSAVIAAIKDCTQVFLHLDRVDDDLLITPLKVWGRYSEAMFRTHRVLIDKGEICVDPLSVDREDQNAYTEALARKSRELADIRDALSRSNQELKQRNVELAEFTERLSEQSRLYQSLRANLDHLLALFRAGQDIGSSLVVDQVCRAIVAATLRLFDVSSCRLHIARSEGVEPVNLVEGSTAEWAARMAQPTLARIREEVCQDVVRSSPLSGEPKAMHVSVAVAPVTLRGSCLGTLEVYAPDLRLDTAETRTLLRYLASEASIALDNAYLYRETQVQGEQLRSFVEDVIVRDEQESRQLAFDLHDGLVQTIVAAYQHLQTAQAWRGRDPNVEERETDQGVRLLRQAINEARRLIAQLRPAGLDDFGLVDALRLYVAQLAADEGWRISLDIDPAWGDLPPALETALFRIAQEAMTNARKYAGARRVQIQLRALQGQFCVSIRDWGKGFDPGTVASVPQQGLHMGLIGIRERARLWGGDCTIESEPGKGTTIQVCIPGSRAVVAEGSRRD